MTDPYGQPAYGEQQAYGQPSPGYGVAPRGYGQPPAASGSERLGPVGQVRGTGVSILLFVVTIGIYGFVWSYKTHEEMKQHTGQGLGGGIGLLIWFALSPALAFLHSDEVGKLYSRRGQQPPVTGLNGLWYLSTFVTLFLFFPGVIIWFVRTNGALNAYWRSVGASG